MNKIRENLEYHATMYNKLVDNIDDYSMLASGVYQSNLNKNEYWVNALVDIDEDDLESMDEEELTKWHLLHYIDVDGTIDVDDIDSVEEVSSNWRSSLYKIMLINN